MLSISEVSQSVRIIKVINEHLAESDCHHNIKSIMQEALENIGAGGQTPVTTLETKDRLQDPLNHALEDR